ncbi:hypothetical protein TASIC1_0004069000 [Trichoderma asperellum]|uniref:Secreted protein n=1 Tax=Trichoderma asperellum TaxID=101201 RepID=A0A6V8QRU1_TRIAP|nr:hypothetical protein TASIC1_0004069000 [Trichoderma asperellum]
MSHSSIRNGASSALVFWLSFLFPLLCSFSSPSFILPKWAPNESDTAQLMATVVAGRAYLAATAMRIKKRHRLASGAPISGIMPLAVRRLGESSQSERRLELLQRASLWPKCVPRLFRTLIGQLADGPPPYSAHLNSAPTATLLGDSGVPQGTTSTWIRPRYCACFSTLHPEFSGSGQSCITGRSRVLVEVWNIKHVSLSNANSDALFADSQRFVDR